MNITQGVLLGVVFVLLVYDGYAAFRWGIWWTISRQILDLSYRYPFIPFLFGGLCGHLFFSQC